MEKAWFSLEMAVENGQNGPKNAKNGWKMCPTDQSTERFSIITLVFICQSMKQTYRSSKYVHFTTQQWILK